MDIRIYQRYNSLSDAVSIRMIVLLMKKSI